MMNKYRLMSPGPTPIPPEVSAAGALPVIHHRTPEFGEVFTRVNENLKRVFLTENDVFTYAASGTGAFEGAIQNLFSPGDKILVVNNGNFGNRWVKMSQAFGLEVTELRYDWGVKADNDEVASALRNDPGIKAAVCVLSETSTGTVNDIEGFAKAASSVVTIRGRGLRARGVHLADGRVGRGRGGRGVSEGPHDAPGPGLRERQREGDGHARRLPDAAVLLRLDGGEEGVREGPLADGVDAGRQPHHPARRRVAADSGRGGRGGLQAPRFAWQGVARGDKGDGPLALRAG
ncbi:aminotransferase class V-fold PLP-dependent enzyme [Rubrobacter marinus]|uniref:Aminotransferase class V-fold PLP-dependent enzyme n=1 Tax=Rubrobacter marinus TaxID=2653852 RepID=A0A6G8PZ45_9ACTN|nr:aminotransferase class V-fold PLP-dependent enzyme [Rubrobacter marinus]